MIVIIVVVKVSYFPLPLFLHQFHKMLSKSSNVVVTSRFEKYAEDDIFVRHQEKWTLSEVYHCSHQTCSNMPPSKTHYNRTYNYRTTFLFGPF